MMGTNKTSPFVTDLFRAAAPKTGNAVLAPHSVALVLGMIALGARGETQRALLRALHLESVSDLQNSIAADEASFRAARKNGFRYESDVSVWARKGLRILRKYGRDAKHFFGASSREIDMGESGRKEINAYVSKVTHGLIPTLLQEPLPDYCQLVATSALWLKAEWLNPFDPEETGNNLFHTQDGDVDIPFLCQVDDYMCFRSALFDSVFIPYKGDLLDFVIILPRNGLSPNQLIRENSSNMLAALHDFAQHPSWEFLLLSAPKLSIIFRSSLAEPLKAMGAEIAFSRNADLSGIADAPEPIMISDVIHNVRLDLDEKGTEAAAATAAVCEASGPPLCPTPFCVDRPFLFLVRHRKTGAILFIGRVENPATT